MGDVRCNRIVHFRSKEPNKKHPVIAGYININATSGSSRWSQLSPMKLGPFDLVESLYPTPDYPDGVHPGFRKRDDEQVARVLVFENYWQFSKIYDVDNYHPGNPPPMKFFARRAKGLQDPQGHRRALPKAKGKPVAAYFDGKIYDYLSSRYVYCSLYEVLIRGTDEYKELEKMVQNGTSVQILGYDGRDVPITEESMRQEYKNPAFPFGHELVLCCMLKGLAPWRK